MFVLIIFACNPATGPRCQEPKENTADGRCRKREGIAFVSTLKRFSSRWVKKAGSSETVVNPSSFFQQPSGWFLLFYFILFWRQDTVGDETPEPELSWYFKASRWVFQAPTLTLRPPSLDCDFPLPEIIIHLLKDTVNVWMSRLKHCSIS